MEDPTRIAQSSLILYQTEDGRTRVECRFQDNSIWLNQSQMADLFRKDVRTISEHLGNIFSEQEKSPEATIRKFRIVRQEGTRQVAREVEHYSLPAILAVGYRVRSSRGTQFRQWSTARLSEYLLKGFVMDDERLRNPPGPGVPDYFDEILERIRDIRASERRTKPNETETPPTASANLPFALCTLHFAIPISGSPSSPRPPRLRVKSGSGEFPSCLRAFV